jgi:hypothetical protein
MDLQEIVPYQGLGDLRLGMTRGEVRDLLGPGFRSFRKTPWSAADTDAYDGLGFHLYYDPQDRLEFIETFPPCRPRYRGVELFGARPKALLRRLAAVGCDAVGDGESYDFRECGFVLYVPDRTIESVAVYRRGYYDEAPGG